MYGCVTDYAAVYDDTYPDRRASHTRFDIGVLPALLAVFCRDAGVNRLLDVSGGQGRLAEALVGLGIRALTTDITGALDSRSSLSTFRATPRLRSRGFDRRPNAFSRVRHTSLPV